MDIGEFQERIPQLAKAVLKIIEDEYKNKQNLRFKIAFDDFTTLCRSSINPHISLEVIKEMLVQHLLTERLFRTIFNNPSFVNRNIIAAEIEKVIQALTVLAFDRQEFLQPLDRFYIAVESAAKGIESWSERQHFLNTVYEHFFKGFSVKQADIHGIVYTPQEVVDFMCASVEEVLRRDFSNMSLGDKGVQILDPAVGTGNFIVNLIRHYIPRGNLQHKYSNDLFCNEITLLPYYIASLNIEHEFFDKMGGGYEPFEGICFADTLELAEDLYKDGADVLKQSKLFMVEENTQRVEKEKAANITIVIGNPPYNMGQKNENDNSKNRPYPVIDERINKTYVKDSNATLNNKLYDPYVRFFRYATDRLRGSGIVCFISNNSFIERIAFDGMRKHLLQDFNTIYHLDLHGNVQSNRKLSGTMHNVFGIKLGVGITIAVKTPQPTEPRLYYYRVPEFWTRVEKLTFLVEKKNITNIEWAELQPDENYTWITQGLHPEFRFFLPMGTKETKGAKGLHNNALFQTYSLGVATNRDEWVYDFDRSALVEKMQRCVRNYNSEVFRWSQEDVHPQILNEKASVLQYIDNFVNNDPSFLKWTDRLKEALYKRATLKFKESKIRSSFYRPFCKKFLYFDHLLNQRRSQQYLIFPTIESELENTVICLTALGSEKPFMVLATTAIPDLHLVGAGAGTQCFPYYTYSDDGSNRSENITDWAQQQFQAKYGSAITKRDIFHYIYAILHHPNYRERYVEDLKRSLPYIPLMEKAEAFWNCVSIGKQLMSLHVNYDKEKEYDLTLVDNETLPYNESRSVERMQLSPDQTSVIINKSLTLSGIPQECFQYRLGTYSALEWVIDQYQITKDKQGRVISDPNRLDDKDYILRLIKQIVTVSVQTVQLIDQLAQMVTVEDWIDEPVERKLGFSGTP
jgi:predicted helicase